MGIVGGLISVPPDLFDEALATPAVAEALRMEEHPRIARRQYLDKSWHVIHYLLTGKAEGGDGPLAKALMGGHRLTGDFERGGLSWGVLPAEVPEVAAALAAFPVERLWIGFDQSRMNDPFIYSPDVDFDEAEPRQYIEHHFRALVAFFKQVAADGDGVIFAAG
jgi:hypothetical protein